MFLHIFSATSIIFYFTLFNTLDQIQSLVEKPVAEDTYIVSTETVIRNTINNLFSALNFDLDLRKPKVKQYSIVHNFFVSITLQDHDNLKEIARLTKLAKTDNSIDIFITQLNEVLNEDNKSDEATDAVYVTTLIGTFLERIEYLKELYGLNNNVSIFDVNKDVLKHLRAGEHFYQNITKSNEDNENLIQPLSPVNATKRRTGNGTDDVLLGEDDYWHPSGRRVFAGKRVGIRKFPFVASVQFFKKFQCGGSIIKSDLVITSASCLQLAWNNRFFRENPSFLSVQVGSDFYETGDENIPVQEIYFHPGYNPKNLRHNLAIMGLQRVLRFAKDVPRIKKIDFDRHPWPLPANTDGITIIGWGARDISNMLKNPWINRLSYAVLEFYPLLECQEIYSKEFVTERHFCAGFFSKGAGACNRDAGGPGVVNGILYGVVSFGSPVCGAPDAPTVFTKLGYYTNWIEEILELKIPRIKVATTVKPDVLPRTFVIPFTHKHELNTIKNRPINDNELPHAKEALLDEENLRTNKMFKDFISTMFESQQIEEYLDQVINKKDNDKQDNDDKPATETDATTQIPKQHNIKAIGAKKRLRHKSTTKVDEIDEESEQVTVMNMETFKLGDLEGMHDMLPKAHKEFKLETKSSKKHTTPPSSDEEKKLEDVIVSLIDNLDIQNILESKSVEKLLSTSQEDSKETLVKKIRNQNELKQEEKRKVSEQESSAPPKLDQATIKEIAKVMNIDESVLTFLYLNNMKIKQNETLKNIKIDTKAFEKKGGLKSRNQHEDKSEDEDADLESDNGGEELENSDEDGSDIDDNDDYSDDEYEALSIQVKAVDKTPVKRYRSKNVLDIVMNDDNIYEKLLEVVEKETT